MPEEKKPPLLVHRAISTSSSCCYRCIATQRNQLLKLTVKLSIHEHSEFFPSVFGGKLTEHKIPQGRGNTLRVQAFHSLKCLALFFSLDPQWVPAGYSLGIMR